MTSPQAMADELDELDEDAPRKYLSFAVADEVYATSVDFVREIVRMQRITTVPEVPAYVRGVMNLRGKVIPVIDVRMRFELPERAYDDRTCIVVVQVWDWFVGLVVDRVTDVLDIRPEQIETPRAAQDSRAMAFLTGLAKVGDQVRLLLDVEKLLAGNGRERPGPVATHD
jgi:purine-binding chemotaxis protein CheW